MDPEKAALLPPPQESSAIGVPVATKQPREFKGRWFHVAGDCGPQDVAATCLAWHAPWVAYGWNAQRSLGLTWWKEALKLMLLTCGVFALVRVLLVVLVETQCPGLPHGPGPHMDHGLHGQRGWHALPNDVPQDRPMLLPGNTGPAGTKPFDPAATAATTTATAAATLTAATAIGQDASTQTADLVDINTRDVEPQVAEDPEPRPHPGHDNHTDPHGDHPHGDHPHGDHPHGDHPHGDEPHGDHPDGDHPHGDHDHDGPRGHDDRPHHHHHHGWHHDDDEDKDVPKPAAGAQSGPADRPQFEFQGEQDDDREDDDEDDDDDDMMMPHHLSAEQREAMHHCAMRVGPWAVVLLSVGISALIYAAYLAALRRRMIRERFGIEGSFKHDLLLWIGCAPCALAQETRTLMFNNVEEGLWQGPLTSAPRQVQPMTV